MKIEESTIVETNDFKVIIYPASRALTAKEVKEITEKLYDFLPTWNAHGKGLTDYVVELEVHKCLKNQKSR